MGCHLNRGKALVLCSVLSCCTAGPCVCAELTTSACEPLQICPSPAQCQLHGGVVLCFCVCWCFRVQFDDIRQLATAALSAADVVRRITLRRLKETFGHTKLQV